MTPQARLDFVLHAAFCEDCSTYLAPLERRRELERTITVWRGAGAKRTSHLPPYRYSCMCEEGFGLAFKAEGMSLA